MMFCVVYIKIVCTKISVNRFKLGKSYRRMTSCYDRCIQRAI
jgi:hypothetical protein